MNTRTRKPRAGSALVSVAVDDRGLSTVEYIVLLVLIVGAAVALWVNIKQDVHDKLTMANSSFAAVGYGSTGSQSAGASESTPAGAQPAVAAAPLPAPAAAAPQTAPAKTKEDR